MVRGVIFDFDGTIVDSEKSRFLSLNEVLKNYNYQITNEAWNLNYKRLRSVLILEDIKYRKKLVYDSNLLYEKSHKIRNKLEEKGVRVIDGFLKFYDFLNKNNIKMIIASGGRRDHVKMIMAIEKLPRIEVLGREDYDNVKPEPDCYLLALKKMNLKSDEVIVFDDSVSGMQASITAGCRTIGINSSDVGVNELDLFMNIHDYNELDFDLFLNY